MLVNNYVRKYSTNHCCIGSTKANTTRPIGQLLQHCLAPFRYSSQIKRMWQELKWDHQEPVVALSRLSQISLVSREVRLYWKATEGMSSTSSSWGFYPIPVPPWLIADVKSGVVFLSDYKSVLPLPHHHHHCHHHHHDQKPESANQESLLEIFRKEMDECRSCYHKSLILNYRITICIALWRQTRPRHTWSMNAENLVLSALLDNLMILMNLMIIWITPVLRLRKGRLAGQVASRPGCRITIKTVHCDQWWPSLIF